MDSLPARPNWPPPPETAEVKREQAKLTAALVNALAIACMATGFVGPLITAIPDSDLGLAVRASLVVTGAVVHLAARFMLRYM